jgi:copper resistance protein B
MPVKKTALSTVRAISLLALTTIMGHVYAQEPPVHDNPIRSFVLVDQLEYGFPKGTNGLRFNGLSWIGGDYNRLWINTEGTKTYGGPLEDTDVQVLYGRLIAPFWDVQGGLRYYRPRSHAPSRGSAVIGVTGIAPYRFEVEAASFISNKGEVSGRVEVEYELLMTQRLIAQPRFETNVAIQRSPELGIGRGINDAELGLRLRYEIRREFAPYVGVSWSSRFGETADFARARGDVVRTLGLVVGIRLWR